MATRPTRNTHRLAAILDNLPDGLLLVDATGTVINANARAVQAFGVSEAASLVGSSLGELLPSLGGLSGSPDGWPMVGESRRVLARPPVGDPFGVEVTCSRVPWGGGEERLLVSLRYGTDSTAEAELVRTGRAAQAVLRSTEEAICGVDRDGRVVLANPAAARLLGAKVSAIAGLDLHSMALHTRLDGSPHPSSESPIARTLRSGRRMQRRREIVWRQDGSPVPVELSTAPMRDGSDIVGAVLAFTDVTEQVELDRRRMRLLETLEDVVAPMLADLWSDPAHFDSLVKLREVVAEAIDYENLMLGQVELDLASAQLDQIVGAAVAAVADGAAQRGVEIVSTVESVEMVGDAARLGRTFAELLRAATHAVANGSVLQVEAGAGAEFVRIAVSGMAEAPGGPRDNPLLRWLRPGKVRERGPDPDLALVQMIAEGHGGQFLLEVAPDGTRAFVVELPSIPPGTARSARRHAKGETVQFDGVIAASAEHEGVDGPTGTVIAMPTRTPVPARSAESGAAPAPAETGPALLAAPPADRGARNGAAAAPGDAPANAPSEASGAARDVSPSDAAAPPGDAAGDGPPSDASHATGDGGPGDASHADPSNASDGAPGRSQASTDGEEPGRTPRPRGLQVFVWPHPTAALAEALGLRNASSVALDAPEQPSVVVPDGTAVLLIDPVGGRLGRRALHDLSEAASSAGVPSVLAVGLAEVESEDAVVDPASVLRAAAPRAGETLRILLVEPGRVLAAALRTSMRRAGHDVVHVHDDAQAAAALGERPPDLVVRNLAGGEGFGQAWAPVWTGSDAKAPVPVIAYSADDLTPGHEQRLPAGTTLLSLAPRAETPSVVSRLAGLVVRLADDG
ncbi:MAG: PAS domain-containing protein [Sporichthyaceae bacterium]